MAERRFLLPPDRRPRGTPPSLAARRFLFELEAAGHRVTVEESPARLHINPGCPHQLGEAMRFAYDLIDIVKEDAQ